MISSPIGIDNNVSNDLSLFLTNDTIPIINPITPKPAINGMGRGILIEIPKVVTFKDINTIKSRVKIAAHFPAVVLDQSWILMIHSSLILISIIKIPRIPWYNFALFKYIFQHSFFSSLVDKKNETLSNYRKGKRSNSIIAILWFTFKFFSVMTEYLSMKNAPPNIRFLCLTFEVHFTWTE